MQRTGATVRHGRSRPVGPRRWLRLLRTALVAVVVCAVAGGSLVAISAWRLTSELAGSAVDIGNGETVEVPSIGAFSGGFTVLLVGADNSSDQTGFGATRDATLNDVNILIHVDEDHTSATVVSLPRDLVIDQPECTDPTTKQVYPEVSAQPLNTAIARGGLGCVVATVEQQTGLTIPYAALFTFEGTVAMADAVGGVQVCVTEAIDDPDSGLQLPAGTSTITGKTALAYLRDRHGVGDGSDLGRIASQQAYMSSLLRKMTSSSTLTSPTKLYALASAAAENVTLSTSLANVDTMVNMMLALKQVPLADIAFVQYPTTADPADAAKVVPDTALAARLMARVKAGEAIALTTGNLGSSVTSASSSSATPTPSPSSSSAAAGSSSSSSSASSGLTGQNASEQTCSVAASN